MRVRARVDRGVQHAGQANVVGVACPPCRLVARFQSRRAAAGCAAHDVTASQTFGGFQDLHVAGAAAQVARERRADGAAVRARIAREERGQCHHEARRAEAALNRAGIDQRALNVRKGAIAGDTLDGDDGALRDFDGERQACADEHAVDEDVARAANAMVAAALGAAQVELVAQHVEQRRVGADERVVRYRVDAERAMHVAPAHDAALATAARTARRTSSGATRRR